MANVAKIRHRRYGRYGGRVSAHYTCTQYTYFTVSRSTTCRHSFKVSGRVRVCSAVQCTVDVHCTALYDLVHPASGKSCTRGSCESQNRSYSVRRSRENVVIDSFSHYGAWQFGRYSRFVVIRVVVATNLFCTQINTKLLLPWIFRRCS